VSAVHTGLDAPGITLLVTAGVAAAVSYRYPRAAVSVVTLVLGTLMIRHYPYGPVWGCGPITLFVLGLRTGRRTALTGALAVIGTLGVVAVATGLPLLPLVFAGWATAAVTLGGMLRTRRAYVTSLAERARYLERTREEEGRRRVAEERLRIARDLHDGVAHAMATINVQAAAAGRVLVKRPEAALNALEIIQRTSGTVLDELAAMLTVLRDPAAGEPEENAEPAPGLDSIGRLVDSAWAAGLRVSLSIDGPIGAVSPVQATAAYRIVQESLTNVLRHAAATAARVTIRAGADHTLRLEVRDDGAGRPHAGTGVGIRGMRERAEATGGHLTAGPGESGGFAVHADWAPRP
jgi:signal transduction histidine kinase